MRDLVVSPAMGVHVGARCGVDARIAPPFIEATARCESTGVCRRGFVSRILTHTQPCGWCRLTLESSGRVRWSPSRRSKIFLTSQKEGVLDARIWSEPYHEDLREQVRSSPCEDLCACQPHVRTSGVMTTSLLFSPQDGASASRPCNGSGLALEKEIT